MADAILRALVSEHGALGLLLAVSFFVIRWLLSERTRLHKERDDARRELRENYLDQLRQAHASNVALAAQVESMRGLRDRITTSRKVVLHASEG
jgi:predicted outer membrane lipoprotein